MKTSYQSRLGSILLSTSCLVAFVFLEGPLMKPSAGVCNGIHVKEPLAGRPAARLRLQAGKSVIMESPATIVNASIDNPECAGAVSLGEHELLVNGKTPGRTSVTIWQEDGRQSQFDLHIEDVPVVKASNLVASYPVPAHGLTASYQNAMERVQTVITGVDR
jgi:Flp pilus assembly secretin CpaC